MRNPVAVISLLGLYILLASFSGKPAPTAIPLPSGKPAGKAMSYATPSSFLYHSLGLEEKGLSPKAFDYAIKGYRRLLKTKRVKETRYLTICDFSQSSHKKRLYVIDMLNGELVMNTYVAHGRNSGREYATRFSNKPSSLQSSLGFYITKNTYYGEHGLSLRVEGLEPGFNHNAYRRAIVVHGATYIGDEGMYRGSLAGRSYGCPAVPKKESAELIHTIQNGTCLFIYHPSRHYLGRSKILND